jgi:high-affinity Fe2+/Pb2+ permease
MIVTTDFICGQAGCAAIGMAFVAAIMLLVAIGWFCELWRQRANRYLEGIEQEIRRERFLKALDQHEDKHSRDDEDAA